GRNLIFLRQRPERSLPPQRVMPPGSAIHGEQLAPLNLCQVEAGELQFGGRIHFVDKGIIKEHSDQEFLERVMAHQRTFPLNSIWGGNVVFKRSKTCRHSSGALCSHSKTTAFKLFARGRTYSKISQVAGRGSGEWSSSIYE